MATARGLRRLLADTSVPPALVDEVLAETNALWLLGERDDVVAGEIVLCHPPLEAGEVRAVVKATDQVGAWRISVVTRDRPGLLATTAGVLANEGLSVADAAVTVLDRSRLALQRVTADGRTDAGDAAWDQLGSRLRAAIGGDDAVAVSWQPTQPVTVECHPQGSGRVMVQVEAPDTVGLLWAIAHHLTEHGSNIEAARLANKDGLANDVLIVTGAVDAEDLALALSPADVVIPTSPLARALVAPLELATAGLRRASALLGRRGSSQ